MHVKNEALGKTEGAQVSVAEFQHGRLSGLLLRFLNGLKRSGKSSHTLSAYRNDLGLFSKFLAETGFHPGTWDNNLSDHWLNFLQEHGRNSAASTRRALMSVRTFLHFLVREGVIENSPLLEAKSPKQPTHDLLTVPEEHYRTIITMLRRRALFGDEKAVRDLTLVLVLGQCGLKASEAAGLTWGDLHLSPAEGTRKPAGSLVIRGENARVISFDAALVEAVALLRSVRQTLRLPTEPGSKLFFGYLNLTRKTRTAALHRHGIKFVVYEVCFDVLGIPYNSESLRNHAIMSWMKQGLDLQETAKLAGYSSLHSLEKFSLQSRGIRRPKRQIRTE